MLDVLLDSLLDTIKVIPYLVVTFLFLEFIEHKLSKKSKTVLEKNKKYGPVVGSVLGALPQCGFGTMAANLFSSHVITLGTIVAIFLSTSDEMLPIMISEKASAVLLLKIIGFKVLVGITVGIIIDLIYKKKDKEHISEICDHDDCHCDKENIFIASLIHTLKISLFILLANVLIGLVIYFVGEDTISNILLSKNIFTYFLASLVGLIPNCASSVIITELYLSKMVTLGTMLSGLLTGSGLGILILFKTNKNMKENLSILSIIYLVGVILGMLVDVII